MKNKLLTAAAVCAVLILCACEEPRATNTVPAYPFDTLHGNWIRQYRNDGRNQVKVLYKKRY